MSEDRYRVQDSLSVRSRLVWRAFVFLALLALGLAILFATSSRPGLAAAWAVIAAGWLGIGLWLWRQHSRLNAQPPEERR